MYVTQYDLRGTLGRYSRLIGVINPILTLQYQDASLSVESTNRNFCNLLMDVTHTQLT